MDVFNPGSHRFTENDEKRILDEAFSVLEGNILTGENLPWAPLLCKDSDRRVAHSNTIIDNSLYHLEISNTQISRPLIRSPQLSFSYQLPAPAILHHQDTSDLLLWKLQQR